MQLKIVVLAVRYACEMIGAQWRDRQQLSRFSQTQAGGK